MTVPPAEPVIVRNEAAEAAAAAAELYRTEIERILRDDSTIGGTRPASRTAATMRAIVIDRAPADFREVYVIHIQAWENLARIDEQLRYLNSQEASDDAWRRWWIETFRGSNETPVSDLESAKARTRDRSRAANERINTSFEEVERVALRYGAHLPRPENPNSNAM